MTSRAITEASYALLGCAAVILAIVSRRSHGRLPTFSALVIWAARRRSAQFGMVLVWWWLGWHFVLGA